VSHFSSKIILTLTLILQGFILSFLFMPLHETLHATAFASQIFNTILSWICGILTGRCPAHYKYYHFAHHRYTGDPKKDPELQNSFLDPNIRTYFGYFLYLTGLPFWIDRIQTNLYHALIGPLPQEFYLQTRASQLHVQREAQLFCVIYLMLFLLSCFFPNLRHFLLYYWVIPTFVGQTFLRFYLLAEHTGCEVVDDMLSNTRTTLTNTLYRRLAWNMPFHAEHHAWPQVPFYLLPELHLMVRENIKKEKLKVGCTPTGENGYFDIHFYFFRWLRTLNK